MPLDKLTNHPKIEMVPLASLSAPEGHPRKHSKKQLAKLASSISRFGFLVPLLLDGEGRVVSGVARMEAARLCGVDWVPIIRVSFLSDTDRRAFVLADNKLAQMGEWDEALLAAELNFLFEDNYDLEPTGFTLSDLDFTLAEEKAGEPETIALPDPDLPVVSRIGDLWHIGPHRIYCGDARLAESFEALLGGDKARILCGDPPYNLKIPGFVSGLGKKKHKNFVLGAGERSKAEFTSDLRAVFKNCARFSVDGTIAYFFMDHRHIGEMLDAADGVLAYKQLLVWVKDNAGLGAFYRSQHELVFVFKSGKAKHVNNFSLGETGRYRTNVLNYAGANTFRKGRMQDLAAHSTVKPTALVADLLLDCSNPGDIALDPYSGSGTLLIAAHKTRRCGAAIELDPKYVDTSIRRLCEASGLVAVHADGTTFEDMARLRASEVPSQE